ncbi:MAG: protein translocase subunit SecF [Dehalococcoidia bacterium]|nr:MAG: protein translocase subunit SecF [Dehalococcoidia bacterium]
MFDIVGKRYWFFLLSALIIIPGIISLAVFGLKPSIDFKSGTSMTLHFSTSVNESQLRSTLADIGYKEAIVQRTGEGDFIVRLSEISTEQNQQLLSGLNTTLDTTTEQKDLSVISPAVASQTARNAVIAVFVAALGILAYITFAFRKMPKPLRWGTCAVAALVHDVLVVTGIFSILGWAAGIEIDAMFITGMLTVVGFSVHDTIVVFDRIRENLSRGGRGNLENVVNSSILQTVTRSLNTSLTVLFVLLALFVLGGATIHNFTLVLIIGIITGTYSSIFSASQLLIVWENREWGRFVSWIPFLRKKKA